MRRIEFLRTLKLRYALVQELEFTHIPLIIGLVEALGAVVVLRVLFL